MSPFPVLLLFISIPLVEIYFLIKVGDVIGAFTTVVLVVATAVLGASIARYQGLVTLQRVQATVARGEAPASEMLEGVILFIGAVLLLVPCPDTGSAPRIENHFAIPGLLPGQTLWIPRAWLKNAHNAAA